MRKLSGTYIKNFKEVPFSIEIPADWTELDSHQYAAIITVLNYNKADRNVIATSLVTLLFGRQNFHVLDHLMPKQTTGNVSLLEDPALANDYSDELIALTNFLYSEPPVRNFFPKLKIRKQWSISPAENLSNLTFGEWCFAYQYYANYRISNDPLWIDKLIACLYRPSDPDHNPNRADYKGDRREVFNENLIAKRSKGVADIEARFKNAVFAWFTVAVNQIMADRPHVFPQALDSPAEEEPATTAQPDHRTWLTVFRELLGPKWGTVEQLKHTNALFVLDALEEQQIAFKEAAPNTNG